MVNTSPHTPYLLFIQHRSTRIPAGNPPSGENPEIPEMSGEAEEDGWL